ncbi:MAG TPA: hypothetical protein VMU16_09245 [Candidatus Binataceae bacterium]|nr:hypothetical protein [Candidatus Binataceae bacterium]
MNRIKGWLIAGVAVACVSAQGCIVIESSTVGERTGSGAAISASASDLGVLRLSAPTGLTQTAQANLLANCATGKVSGVTTELSMRDFFIVQSYTVSATGVCQ